MIKGVYRYQGEDIREAHAIRREVFIEEQQIDPAEEYDEWDAKAIHGIVYDDEGAPCATARLLLLDDGTFHIGRVAVRKCHRRKGYGDFIMRMMLDKAFLCGAQTVYIGAQLQAIPFYESLGFCAYGEEYLDAGIPHRHMKVEKGEVTRACGGHC